MLTVVLIIAQLLFVIVAGLYFYENLKNQKASKSVALADSQREMERLARLRAIKLTEPLSEQTRPSSLDSIVEMCIRDSLSTEHILPRLAQRSAWRSFFPP